MIIHLERLWSCKAVKIWILHWKLKFSESQYCFPNISVTKARIFMKFYMVVNWYLVSLCVKFHEDLCINARARGVNTRTHVLSRFRTFTTRLCTFMHGSSWNLTHKLTRYCLTTILNFIKIGASVGEIFAKQYWCFLIVDFQCIFHIPLTIHLQSLQRWIIT